MTTALVGVVAWLVVIAAAIVVGRRNRRAAMASAAAAPAEVPVPVQFWFCTCGAYGEVFGTEESVDDYYDALVPHRGGDSAVHRVSVG